MQRYRINYASSFVMALMFKDEKPEADIFMTSSQSQDPDSIHFIDQTKLYRTSAFLLVKFGRIQPAKSI
ncbi:penicillin acylase family protein [Shewanella sp. 202IG2-18]|nr:penicillin acylase family protein [Parashewanella hymeniacidonis]